jgi:hypothetical protein
MRLLAHWWDRYDRIMAGVMCQSHTHRFW